MIVFFRKSPFQKQNKQKVTEFSGQSIAKTKIRPELNQSEDSRFFFLLFFFFFFFFFKFQKSPKILFFSRGGQSNDDGNSFIFLFFTFGREGKQSCWLHQMAQTLMSFESLYLTHLMMIVFGFFIFLRKTNKHFVYNF